MRKKAAVSNLLFRAVTIFFSAILLLLVLISSVKLMAVERSNEELERNIQKAGKEAELLRVDLENRLSLKEIENLAVNELGMHRPSMEQLYFDMIPG